ncbi:MAG: RES family NAD+ phosphorylase [Flavobacteriales bacterium]|nr:RES family NAD+ phosphorylase [Flavobacteriales bacterium]
MRVFRLTRRKYAESLSGKGAALFANRWNSKGTEIVYSSESRALAMAEVAVHLPNGLIPADYVMLEIQLPTSVTIPTLSASKLPDRWQVHPPGVHTQQLGDAFILESKSLALRVPSAVVPGDHNVLINPFHRDFKKVKIVDISDFPFDERLFNPR